MVQCGPALLASGYDLDLHEDFRLYQLSDDLQHEGGPNVAKEFASHLHIRRDVRSIRQRST
jgi:hypothetical protein